MPTFLMTTSLTSHHSSKTILFRHFEPLGSPVKVIASSEQQVFRHWRKIEEEEGKEKRRKGWTEALRHRLETRPEKDCRSFCEVWISLFLFRPFLFLTNPIGFDCINDAYSYCICYSILLVKPDKSSYHNVLPQYRYGPSTLEVK